MTKADDLESHVLACLAAARGWKHGYAVRRWLIDHLEMEVALASIYRVIDRLHKNGLVDLQETSFLESYAGRPRKNYRLSHAGWNCITERAITVRVQVDRLQRSLLEFTKALSHGQEGKQTG